MNKQPGPDWYCNYCDKMVPHVDSKDGHHDEAKGGCGNVLSSCKFDPSTAPGDWYKLGYSDGRRQIGRHPPPDVHSRREYLDGHDEAMRDFNLND